MLRELDERLAGLPAPAEIGVALARIDEAETAVTIARERDTGARQALAAANDAHGAVRTRGQSARRVVPDPA